MQYVDALEEPGDVADPMFCLAVDAYQLMIKIEKLLKARGFTQSEAARILRVSQPRVSDLLRGRLDPFSTDALIDMLARLGISVPLAFASSKSSKSRLTAADSPGLRVAWTEGRDRAIQRTRRGSIARGGTDQERRIWCLRPTKASARRTAAAPAKTKGIPIRTASREAPMKSRNGIGWSGPTYQRAV